MGHVVGQVWETGSSRWENDDGTLDTSTFIAAENTAITQDWDVNFRLRFNWGENAGQSEAVTFTSHLEYRINGGAWTKVTATSAIFASPSANETDNATSTTERLTTPPPVAATYINSRFEEGDGILGAVAPSDAYYEDVWNLQADSAQLTHGDGIEFQIVDSSGTETVTTIDTVPSLTVRDPTVNGFIPAWAGNSNNLMGGL